jgi:hypothetical protein
MALVKTLPDPFGGPDLADCYLRWGDLVISPRTETVRVVFQAFRSEAARLAGRAPLPIPVAFEVGPVGGPAVFGPAPVLDPGDPAADPPVPPTYGEPPLLAPAVPSYAEFTAGMGGTIDGQPGAADVIGALVYGYAKSRPELADAQDA